VPSTEPATALLAAHGWAAGETAVASPNRCKFAAALRFPGRV
jgi:hypothetical protein